MNSQNLNEEAMALRALMPLVRDLQRPRALVYWTDLLCCVAAGLLGMYLSQPFPDAVLAGSPLAVAGLFLAAFAFYRASYFNHELAHQSRHLPGFSAGWNVLVGIPLLVPSFLYSDHRNHHSLRGFATESDIEYFPPSMRGLRGVFALLVACLLLPIAYVLRFLVLAPATLFSPRLRRWVDLRASGLGILGLSRRAPPTDEEVRSWRVQEFACFGYLVAVVAFLAAGVLPFGSVLQFYTISVILLVLHAIRIMVGHRYTVEDGPSTRAEQVLDSFNFTRNRPVTWLMAPLGFHLHALHHLFPNVPYHNMAEAHRRISAALPEDSFYHATEAPSYFREVWNFVTRRPPQQPATAATGSAMESALSETRARPAAAR